MTWANLRRYFGPTRLYANCYPGTMSSSFLGHLARTQQYGLDQQIQNQRMVLDDSLQQLRDWQDIQKTLRRQTASAARYFSK
ncbi:hypothetical protein LINGRAHAP2_LOCUS2867, partial [Linum grandiflorum]